jgi:hypothetical protein
MRGKFSKARISEIRVAAALGGPAEPRISTEGGAVPRNSAFFFWRYVSAARAAKLPRVAAVGGVIFGDCRRFVCGPARQTFVLGPGVVKLVSDPRRSA